MKKCQNMNFIAPKTATNILLNVGFDKDYNG